MSKKKAFTLAEVLITLGIIGVVAALTMPSLMSNYRRKVAETQLKQTYSILLNAVTKGEQEVDAPFIWAYPMNYHHDICPTGYEFYACNNAMYQDFLKDNLSDNMLELKEDEGRVANVSASLHSILAGKKLILPNNTLVSVYGGAFTVVLKGSSKKTTVSVIGKNTFLFGKISISDYEYATRGKPPALMPMYGTVSRDKLKTDCQSTNKDTALAACSQLFIQDGLTFKKDYPIRF